MYAVSEMVGCAFGDQRSMQVAVSRRGPGAGLAPAGFRRLSRAQRMERFGVGLRFDIQGFLTIQGRTARSEPLGRLGVERLRVGPDGSGDRSDRDRPAGGESSGCRYRCRRCKRGLQAPSSELFSIGSRSRGRRSQDLIAKAAIQRPYPKGPECKGALIQGFPDRKRVRSWVRYPRPDSRARWERCLHVARCDVGWPAVPRPVRSRVKGFRSPTGAGA